MFRVDRIRAVVPTGSPSSPKRPDSDRRRLHRAGDASPSSCAPGSAQMPGGVSDEAVTERADGSLEIVLAVSEAAWLERVLLLRPDPMPGPSHPRNSQRSPPTPQRDPARYSARPSVETTRGSADLTPERRARMRGCHR